MYLISFKWDKLVEARENYIKGITDWYANYLADSNIDSIQGALRHTIWPKSDLSSWGIDLPWACYGIPQQLFLDNAWAHHSHSLAQLSRAISQGGQYNSIDLVFDPPTGVAMGP